jgi:primary-amine oxidase
VDTQSKNVLGHPRSYEIIPTGGQGRGASNEAFAQGQLYALRYKPQEFPLSSVDGRELKRALPSYLTAEILTDSDVVLYYVMQEHHLPRSEDWPLMPVQFAGFTLMPRDFLDGSPFHTGK